MLLNDEQGERTEQPTSLRLEEARRRGQVPRSSDLASAVLVLGLVAVLGWVGPRMLSGLTGMTATMLDGGSSGGTGFQPVSAQLEKLCHHDLWNSAQPVLICLGVLAGASVVLAVLGNVLQTGLLANAEQVQPDVSRISPATGLKRLFSARSLARAAAMVAKLAAVGAICWATLTPAIMDAMKLGDSGASELAGSAGQALYSLGLRLGAAMLVLAVLDYLYQRWQHNRDLMMTPRQVREDMKRMEGDPQIRSRRRHAARSLSAQRSAGKLSNASVVITSPSGLAVALRFAKPMRAPRVIAKGHAAFGTRIARQAASAGVAVVEDQALALTIYRRARVGQEVPRTTHEKVAEILAFAEQTR